MNNLGFAGLEIQAKTKPKEKKIKKATSSSKEPGKVKKKKQVKPEEVEVATPITSSMSRSDSVRRESDIFPLESRQDEEEQDDITRNEEAQEDEELLHGYHDPDLHPADNGKEDGEQQKDEQEHRSATPEERRSPTPVDNQVEDVDWSPAPGEDENHLLIWKMSKSRGD
uniref:Uncharacterized protein n=1 Tax=Ditylenchus dipsaci TaxID=166011 RepID=A0A915DNI6_9BILA